MALSGAAPIYGEDTKWASAKALKENTEQLASLRILRIMNAF